MNKTNDNICFFLEEKVDDTREINYSEIQTMMKELTEDFVSDYNSIDEYENEYKDVEDMSERTAKLSSMCRHVAKTAILYHNVAIIDGVAIIGATGQYNTTTNTDLKTTAELEFLGYEDITYLKNSIEKLQRHVDVKRIIIVTNSVPGIELYFGEEPGFIKNQLPLNLVLGSDTEKKVVSWIYGTYGKIVDTNFNGINYINNSYFKRNPYWAKRVEINF